jgi:imidazolonepropionase-like amidohydrolase
VINLPSAGGGGGRGGGGGTQRAAGAVKTDLIYEGMRPLFAKEVPALIPASTEAAIRSAIEFGDQWGIKVVIMGGAQAWRVRQLLAQKQVPVVLSSLQSAPGGNSPYDEIYAQPGLLHEAGVKFAFSTGGGGNARHVPLHAALAVAYGLPADAALKALTIWPAEMFGADKDIGSIARGKLANLIVATGDPLDLRTQISEVFIKGRQTPDDDRHSRLYLKYKARPLPPKVIVP